MGHIHEILLFIKGQGGVVSRYNLDRYITTFVKFDQSFNSIPAQLIEQNLVRIEVNPENNGKMVSLTDFASEKIGECFDKISSILSIIRSKFDDPDDIRLTIPRLFLTYMGDRYHFWVLQLKEKIALNVEVSKDTTQGLELQNYHYELNDNPRELEKRLNFILNEVMSPKI